MTVGMTEKQEVDSSPSSRALSNSHPREGGDPERHQDGFPLTACGNDRGEREFRGLKKKKGSQYFTQNISRG